MILEVGLQILFILYQKFLISQIGTTQDVLIEKKDKSFKDNFDQKKVDEILDKIANSGYESLTKEEKKYLFKIGKK